MSGNIGRFGEVSEDDYNNALAAMVAGTEYELRAVVDPAGLPVIVLVLIHPQAGRVAFGFRPDIARGVGQDIEWSANQAMFFGAFKHLLAENHVAPGVVAGMAERLTNIMIGQGAEIDRLRAENGGPS